MIVRSIIIKWPVPWSISSRSVAVSRRSCQAASDVNVDGLDLEVSENAGELWGHGLPP
jgi:hypothetical protein